MGERRAPPSATVAPRLEIRLFGRPEFRRGDRVLPPLATHKTLSLLAYLISHRDRPHSRDVLATLFWGDRDEIHARRSLATAVWRIRQLLGEDFLTSDSSSVQFNPTRPFWLDVAEFEKISDFRFSISDLPAQSEIENLKSEIELYRGDFLDGLYDDWCIQERYRLEALYLDALNRLVTWYETENDFPSVLRYAQEYLGRDPLQERLHLAVIRARVASGDWAGAQRQWQLYCQVRQQELNLPPSPEMLRQASLLGAALTIPQGAVRQERQMPLASPRWSSLERPPFVGRTREFNALLAQWQEAASGKGLLIFIGGEAGIGKSRLIEELMQAILQRGGWTVCGHCYEYERSMPHAPLADLVRASLSTTGPQVLKHLAAWQIAELVRLLPELVHSVAEESGERFSIPSPAWGDPDQGQARFFEALILFLQSLARQNPLFLALEDLQWASDSTLTWLHFFARRLHQAPILCLVTFRSDEVGTEHPLYRMMLDLEQKGLSARLELTRLPLTALAIWMMGVSDSFVARLYRQTEGNPFFTLETVRALVEDGRLHRIGERWTDDPALTDLPVPTSISQVIHSRLGRLMSPAREAVAIAAVMGRTFDFDVLVQALGWSEEAALTALDELLRCRLIREASGSAREDYEFDHHLVQEVIYQGLHYRQRRRLHRLVGQAMERVYADRSGVAGELAHHFERALEKTQALRYLFQAAHDAAVLFAHDEALGYWKRAFSIVASLRQSEVAALRESIGNALIARAELYHLQGCLQERAADLRQLRQLAEQAADAPLLDQALIREAHYLNLDGRYAQAIEKARAAAVRCRERGDADGESHALAEWGFAHYFLGEYNAAMQVLNTALVLEHLAPVVRGQVLSVLSYAHYLIADYPRSLDYRQQALAIRHALGQQTRVAEDLTDMGILYTRLNQLPQAEQYLLDALKLAREIGSQVAESYALNQLGILHYVRGDYSAALKCHTDSLALQRATGSRRGEASAVNNVGIVHLALGDYAAAEAELREALAIHEEIAYARGVVKALAHLARVLAVLERRADALTAVTRALALAKSIGDRYGQTTALVILAQLHLAENEPTPALTLAREAVALAQEINLTSGYIFGLSLLALGYLTSGDAQTAEQYSAQAVTRLREQGCIEGSEEEIYLTHYRILSALGKDEQAAAALQQARAEVVRKAERLKDEPLRRRFREEVPTNREIMTANRAAVSC